MILLIEYFTSSNFNRDREYLTCISENIKNPLIEKICVFISDDFSKLNIESDKIDIIKLNTRPTFNFLFNYSNQNFSDNICIIANTDIILDQTLENIKIENLNNTFLALTRWDLIFQNNSWSIQFYDQPWRNISTSLLSQDTWIYRTPIVVNDQSNFLMGKPGCDNRIAQVYHELGYNVKNPSKKIITKHLHLTNYRTYNHTDMVLGPYLLVQSTDDVNIDCQKQTIPHF